MADEWRAGGRNSRRGADPEEEEDDDLSLEDDSDSDEDWQQEGYDSLRKSKWFAEFVAVADSLNPESLKDAGRQWHCPACKGGPGAVAWFQGIQSLLAHAKTVRSKRVKLHKRFAKLVECELNLGKDREPALARRVCAGNGIVRELDAYGSSSGKSTSVVWPPMVIVYNTSKFQPDRDGKKLGVGNSELLQKFSEYNPVKAKQAYGPHGHRGFSLLVFAASPDGYVNARGLHEHLAKSKAMMKPGSADFYGHYATPESLKDFNKHAKGKAAVKWEMKSSEELVTEQLANGLAKGLTISSAT